MAEERKWRVVTVHPDPGSLVVSGTAAVTACCCSPAELEQLLNNDYEIDTVLTCDVAVRDVQLKDGGKRGLAYAAVVILKKKDDFE